jgi:signal transduction histidine kinase
VKCPILPCRAFLPTNLLLNAGKWERTLQRAPDPAAGRAHAIDLKLRLALRVAALAAVCFLAVAAYALFDSDRLARAKASHIAEIVAKDISLQQAEAQWFSLSPSATPDLQRAAAPLMEPGLCISYRDGVGAFRQGLCSGALEGEIAAPESFAALYRAIFHPGQPVSMPLLIEGEARGVAVATFDPATQIGQSWREASRLLSIMAFALAGLCLAVYAALARALRPTRAIRAGLNQLAANDLSVRLPRFDLAELSAISDVFNALAQKLEATLAERNALTRKLIAVQDEERRHLARELHDEFGQSLTAIAAQAAAAAHTAERECPPLLEECQGISRTTAGMMETLRGALVRLRPPDIEELGLSLSLESLVANWNGFEKGRTRFEIAVTGKVDDLPSSVCASLYRIAQEAITNAAKHAQASCVQLRLDAGSTDIILRVEDDGEATDGRLAPKPGMGLLGMQERVVSLGGTLRFERRATGGTCLVATIPNMGSEP